MARIVVGPVIGKVTQSVARVLVEVDATVTVIGTASSPGRPAVTASVRCPNGRPRVLCFEGLEPGAEYRLSFAGASARAGIHGRFRTLPAPCESINFAAVSCNKTYLNGDTDLWADLADRYIEPGDIDYVLHVGDQVYGDDAFLEAQRVLGKSAAWPSPQKREAIRELYRRLYRLTWSWPSTARALAQVPNLMIWDDHEIRDDWGSRPSDKAGSDHQALIIGRLARQVYREYQRQLWDDIDPDAEATDGSEQHHHVFGSIGVIFVDQRGGRSFSTSVSRPYLGEEQWRQLNDDLLSAGGAFEEVTALIVVTSVPLVYLGPNVTMVAVHAKDDLADHWSFGPNAKEQLEFIRLLRRWKQTRPDRRELLVIGGDVHVGGQTEIRHRDELIFKQLVTSPMTNRPPRFWELKGLQAALEQDQNLGDSYRFEHSGFRNRRNYGIVIARGSALPPLLRGSLNYEP